MNGAIRECLREQTVPTKLAIFVALAWFFLPPIVMWEFGSITPYYGSTIVLGISVVNGLPYALVLAIGTVPLLPVGGCGFREPNSDATGSGEVSLRHALEHVVLGMFYSLSATFFGGLALGTLIVRGGSAPTSIAPYTVVVFAGILFGALFVTFQLQRYRWLDVQLTWRRTGTTGVLGSLVALSPLIALVMFVGPIGLL